MQKRQSKIRKRDSKNIKRDSLIKLAQCLDTSPEYLLGWEDMPNNVEVADASNYVNIPIIGRVAAGLSCFAETNITDYEPVNKNAFAVTNHSFFLRVVGDSMYPLFYGGRPCACQMSVVG